MYNICGIALIIFLHVKHKTEFWKAEAYRQMVQLEIAEDDPF